MLTTAAYQDINDVAKSLSTDLKNGLHNSLIYNLKSKFGPNVLPKMKKKSFLSMIMEQFEDLLVIILLAAAMISFLLGFLEEKDSLFNAFVEPLVIMLILIANAIVCVVQESNAANAIAGLKEYESSSSTVIRDGVLSTLDTSELVPGDLVKLTVGERVPADCRLVEITSNGYLMCDESMLTGETVSKSKHVHPLLEQGHYVLQDLTNMLFSGSLLIKGRCLVVVVKTGRNTELGKIHSELEKIESEKAKTPLQEKLDIFAAQLSKLILAICVLVWIVNIGHFTDPEHGGVLKGAVHYFKIAVSLAVAAIPEGLPAVVTTCLALGTMRMAKKKAIVRTLPSVETLGCTTVICSDKTGTLTTNKINVSAILTIDRKENEQLVFRRFKVAGVDYSPGGVVTDETDGKMLASPSSESPQLAKIAQISLFCNESSVSAKRVGGKTKYEVSGMPVEAALKVLAARLGFSADGTRVAFFDFDRERKLMSTIDVVRLPGGRGDKQAGEMGRKLCHVKGAPEHVISQSKFFLSHAGQVVSFDSEQKQPIQDELIRMADDGLRMLGFAFKVIEDDEPKQTSGGDFDQAAFKTKSDGFLEHERDLVFVGVCGMLDPPRAEVAEYIGKCHRSGIQVKVVTGDHKGTAENICKKIGLFGSEEEYSPLFSQKSITGNDFMAMSDAAKLEAVGKTILFSRVEPSQKLEIVRLLKKRGHVVAMTGDGVNDASALRCADIGVAMGSGTQVAQQAADMVLQDDNFGTIVNAIEEGRSIYANTKQFIRYLISSNIGEVICVFLTALLGIPEVLIPVQLLWVNLVTDGLPATALGFNPADKDIMLQPPRRRDEKIISGWLLFRYAAVGAYIGAATVFGFVWWFVLHAGGPKVTFSQLRLYHSCGSNLSLFPEGFDCAVFHDRAPSTVALSILVTIEMFNAFNALSENNSLFEIPPWRNLYLVAAVLLSFALHFVVVYVPFFQAVFSTSGLNFGEWGTVLLLSFPVVLIDEMLKLISKQMRVYRAETRLNKYD